MNAQTVRKWPVFKSVQLVVSQMPTTPYLKGTVYSTL